MSYLFGDDPDFSARPQPNERPDLPTTFSDTFAAQWSRNQLFAQDYFGEHDRFSALQDYIDTIKQKTNVDFGPELDFGDTSGVGVMPAAQSMLQQVNDRLAKLKAQNPTLDLQPMTADELEQNAVAKRRKADADFQATMGRERGPGATFGAITGGITTAAFGDPINLALLPIAPEESLGIVANAVRWGLLGGIGQTVSTALQAPYREEVQPGYIQSGQPFLDIATATGETAAGGLIFRGLADAWSRVMKGAWPESIKQAGNVVASQANVIASNVYPSPAGEVAHPQALLKASNDILAGRPVDVSQHITPELDATAAMPAVEAARTQAQAAAVAAAQARAAVPTAPQPELPFARTAAEAEAEAAKQAVSTNVQQIARRAAAPYDMPADEAARVADKLAKASPEEAQDLLRDLHMSPRQVADAPTRIAAPPEAAPVPVAPVTQATPELHDAMRADLDRELAAAPAAAGSRGELAQMLAKGAPTEQLLEHPEVQRAIRENEARVPTGTAEDFKNPQWQAQRVYDFRRPDGTIEKVKGWDAAVARLTDQAKEFAGGEVRNEGRAVVILGGPAAGKSTISEQLAREYGAAIVDADEAKKIIPEYENGLGSLAAHDESTYLAKDVLKQLVPNSTNVVLPKVGSNVEQIRGIMTELKDKGYKVDLVHVAVPVEVAQRRNLQRLIKTGRLVEPEYIAQVGEKPLETAHILRGEASDYAEIDTHQNTVQGTGPLAEMVRSGRQRGPSPVGGVEGAPRRGEETRYPTAVAGGAAARAPEEVIPNIDEKPVGLAQALSEVDGFKAAAEQLAACGAPAQAEAA